jgi:hypothetical protein
MFTVFYECTRAVILRKENNYLCLTIIPCVPGALAARRRARKAAFRDDIFPQRAAFVPVINYALT